MIAVLGQKSLRVNVASVKARRTRIQVVPRKGRRKVPKRLPGISADNCVLVCCFLIHFFFIFMSFTLFRVFFEKLS